MHQLRKTEGNFFYIFVIGLFCLTLCPLESVIGAGLQTISHKVPHRSVDPHYEKYGVDPKIELHLHEVVDTAKLHEVSNNGKVILFIHGATFPGSVAFDLQHKNVSIMREIASEGWDTFALDLEGYGQSPRPDVMDDPAKYPDDPAPITREVTIANVAAAVEYIRKLRSVERVHLLGWSLGASIEVPRYTIANPHKVSSITLYAPGYRGRKSDDQDKNNEVLEQWRQQKVRYGNPSKSIDRFVDFGSPAENLIEGVFDVYAAAHTASDPMSAELGGKVRAPWGRFSVLFSESPMFDASKITAPTLIVRGENDPLSALEDMQNLLAALGTDEKFLETIPNAGHMAHMEKSNEGFHSALVAFLNRFSD